MSYTRNQISFSVITITAILGAVVSQVGYARTKTPLPETVSTIPSASAVRAVDLGLDTAAASLVWLKINQGVYTWLGKDAPYERFSNEIQTLTDLDPKWAYPYSFGVLLLPGLGQKELAVKLGEKGLENVKDDWRIPYYMAIVYHSSFKDRLNAAKYFAVAAMVPGAPENVKKMPTIYGTSKNRVEEMIQIWQTVLESSDNELLKEQAQKYILYLEELQKREKAVS